MGELSRSRTSNSSAALTILNLSESFNEILKWKLTVEAEQIPMK